MIIISVKYSEDGGYCVYHTVGTQIWETHVPIDNVEVLEWITLGNTPQLALSPSEIITKITNKIKGERDRRWYKGGVKVGTNWFLTTPIAQGEYNSMLLLSQGQLDTYVIRANWRPMSGGVIDMTVGLLNQIITTGFIQLAAIDDASQTHIANVKLSANPSTYNYLTNWPVIYGE